MTESLDTGDFSPATASRNAVADQLLAVIRSVEGVGAVYPAHPLWQTVAGAAMAAVGAEALPAVSVTDSGDVLAVKTRIAVNAAFPAPAVARAVAQSVRQHLLPQVVAVEVSVVKVGS